MGTEAREPMLRPRLPGESKNAYKAILDYCRMGSGRSLRNLVDHYVRQFADEYQTPKPDSSTPACVFPRPPTIRWSTISTWSARYGWVEAAAEWDKEAERLDQELWERRRAELREREWDLGERLQERARKALEEQNLPDFKASDIPRMADTGSKLSRLATGQPTDSVEVQDNGLTFDQRVERVAAIFDAARARRNRQAADGEQPVESE